MFQNISADDAVVSVIGQVRRLDGRVHDSSIIGLGRVGPVSIGFDGIDGDAGIGQELAENSLRRADIQHLLGPQFLKESCNLLMAALRIASQPVMFARHHALSNDGPARNAALRPRSASRRGCH